MRVPYRPLHPCQVRTDRGSWQCRQSALNCQVLLSTIDVDPSRSAYKTVAESNWTALLPRLTSAGPGTILPAVISHGSVEDRFHAQIVTQSHGSLRLTRHTQSAYLRGRHSISIASKDWCSASAAGYSGR